MDTGIRETDWLGRYWTKWSDALAEAGYEANEFQQRYTDAQVLEKLAFFVSELGHYPLKAEFQMKARSDREFPSSSVWRRLGPKVELVTKLMQYCADRPELSGIVEICRKTLPPNNLEHASSIADEVPARVGFVYLMKFRSDYKIGTSTDPDRRYGELATQMPDTLVKIHTIKTDDPFGVESYWHKRFESKRLKGEWFGLSLADVRAFKRWKNIF